MVGLWSSICTDPRNACSSLLLRGAFPPSGPPRRDDLRDRGDQEQLTYDGLGDSKCLPKVVDWEQISVTRGRQGDRSARPNRKGLWTRSRNVSRLGKSKRETCLPPLGLPWSLVVVGWYHNDRHVGVGDQTLTGGAEQ